jgi:multidrug efflux pump subunit AcrB
MNIAEWSIRNSVITWVLTILLVAVGWVFFNSLSRLEDPEFTIKDAVIMTPYPGASAAEVAEEVTNVIEKAVQEMGQLDRVESRSSRDLSIVQVTMKDSYDKATLPQVWDELRRKVGDCQRQLPFGAGPSLVNDDFGDVYGVFLAITGDGYSYREVYEYAKFLQRELLKAQDVKRIVFYGVQSERIYIEMRRENMARFGVSPSDIYSALEAKNVPASAGRLVLGKEYIPVSPTGEFASEQEIGGLLVKGRSSGAAGGTVFLRDVADISRGYQEPPQTLLRYDGKPAIGLAISTVLGGNVITMGESLKERMGEIESMRPVGIDLNVISLQSRSVVESISGFLVNLLEAVAIVVVVLLVFMGLRSGLIIGAVLLVTIMGTFIVMKMGDVTLERISLGALIIALGMLVDNAIVVADGMKVKMQQGLDALSAARDTVGQVAGPLLGGTFVAVAAFAAIGTSQDSTGEYCRTLFWVILISLSMSWFTAVTTTPLLCKTFFKSSPKGPGGTGAGDAYGGKFYALYRLFLGACIRRRWLTVTAVLILFAASLFGFGFVKKSFFPDSTRPQFYVDFWLPEGTDIRATQRRLEIAEQYLAQQEGVTHFTTMLGGSQVRFLLTFTTEKPYDNFGQILVDVDDYRRIPEMAQRVQQDLDEMFPGAVVNVRKFVLGSSTGGKIQLRLYGSDAVVLRELGEKAERVLQADPGAKAVRIEWLEMSKVVRPLMDETTALRAGIERPDIARAFKQAFEGVQVGVFRERDELLPIVARSPLAEWADLDSMVAVRVWSPVAQASIPVGQVLTGIDTVFENAHLWRRDRQMMLRIHADTRAELPSELMQRVKPEIEKVLRVDVAAVLGKTPSAGSSDPFEDHSAQTLPVAYDAKWPLAGLPGYSMAWGGEAEDSAKANSRLASSMPLFFGLMVLIVLFLFNSIKITLVIWLTVPLAIIGVTIGLLAFRQPFGFMALLGLMSLSGMLIKNVIVLIDEINVQLAQGGPPLKAIIDSGVSRLIPVSMAALTTILGMLPLVLDAFFVSMAVTIMFGLGFATVLTLIFVPVLYSIFFGIRYEKCC